MKSPIDIGTVEGAKHKKMVPVPKPGANGVAHVKTVDSIEIDRLLDNGTISLEQWGTCNQVYALLYKAGMLGSLKSSLAISGYSGDPQAISNKKAESILMVSGLIAHLDRELGPDIRRHFINVLVLDYRVYNPAGRAQMAKAIEKSEIFLS